MEIKFRCENENCPSPESESYVKVLEVDAIMDEKNMATLYCPYCKKALVKDSKDTEMA